jgi:hypothetical protein
MRKAILLALAVLAGCATPPDRYDAFADAMRGYAGRLAAETEMVPPAAWNPPPEPPARRGRRVEAPHPAPPPDCSRPATPAERQGCTAAERTALLAVTQAHARALSDYVATLRSLATRITGPAERDAVRFTRQEVFNAGERLMELLRLTEQDLPPIRSVEARVGLRPAFGAEMSEHGWRIRRQMELQDAALARLEVLRGPELAADLPRLRWGFAYLRSGFEALILSDRDALPEIEQAREALAIRPPA